MKSYPVLGTHVRSVSMDASHGMMKLTLHEPETATDSMAMTPSWQRDS